MDRKQIGVKLTMDALGLVDFKMFPFEERLILQKAIYLSQAAGVHLGYFFRWYLHGPYCSDLTEDAFEIVSAIKSQMDDSDKWKLDDISLSKLSKIKPLLSEKDRKKLAEKVELLASVHFLIDRKQVRARDPRQIQQILKNYKKPFDETQVRNALRELEKHALLS
jgi:uncharacterized protein YwgA